MPPPNKPVTTRLTLVVLLFTEPEGQVEFEQFETNAARIMKRYGGAIERRISLSSRSDPSEPQEVHVLTFPDRESFDRYRNDPELQALAGLRRKTIRDTIIWSGLDCPPFGRRDPG
jgi:uncharacterized protein (DUF1330 family)